MGIEKRMKTNNTDAVNGVTATSKAKLIIFEILVLVGSFNYLQLFADTIAKYTGYPIATYGVPILTASVLAFAFGQLIKLDRLCMVKFVIVSDIVAIAPISIFMLVLNLSSGPF